CVQSTFLLASSQLSCRPNLVQASRQESRPVHFLLLGPRRFYFPTFRNGSQPPRARTRCFCNGPSGSTIATFGPEVITPIGLMRSPQNLLGIPGNFSRRAVKSNS